MELNPRKNISRMPAQSAKSREMRWTKVWTWSTAQPTISEISVFLSLVASYNKASAFVFMSFTYTLTTADLESHRRLWHHHENSRHLKSTGRKEEALLLSSRNPNGRLEPQSNHKTCPCLKTNTLGQLAFLLAFREAPHDLGVCSVPMVILPVTAHMP